MWLLLRLLTAVILLVVRNRATRGFTPDSGNGPDTRGIFKKIRNVKNGPPIVEFAIAVPVDVSRFSIAKETKTDRFFKAVGYSKEIQTGHKEFDDKLYIQTDNELLSRLLLQDEDVRSAVFELFRNEVTTLENRNGYLWVATQAHGYEEAIASTLVLIQERLVSIKDSTRHGALKNFFWKAALVEGLTAFFLVYAASAYGNLVYDHETFTLDRDAFLRSFTTAVAFIFTAYVAFTLALLKGSSRGHRIFVESVAIGIVAVPVSAFLFLSDLNRFADESKPTVLEALIDSKFTRVSGSYSRSRRTHYQLTLKQFRWPEGQGEIEIASLPSRIEVQPGTFLQAEAGRSVLFQVHKGFLGYAWVSELKISEPSSAWPQRQTDNLETSAGVSWAAELEAIDFTKSYKESTTDSSRENRIENWPNGKIKSREPVQNGEVHGLAEYYHSNGQLYGKIPFVNGKKHGVFVLYREDGSKDQVLSYKEGAAHGVLEWYKPGGQALERWVYVNGNATRKLPLEQ